MKYGGGGEEDRGLEKKKKRELGAARCEISARECRLQRLRDGGSGGGSRGQKGGWRLDFLYRYKTCTRREECCGDALSCVELR